MQLTENANEGVSHDVAKLVRGVALVDGAGPDLYVVDDHGVVVHFAASVRSGVCHTQAG